MLEGEVGTIRRCPASLVIQINTDALGRKITLPIVEAQRIGRTIMAQEVMMVTRMAAMMERAKMVISRTRMKILQTKTMTTRAKARM